MKIRLKVYEYKGMLKRELSNVEEAERFAKDMTKKHSNLIFEPYIELDEICLIEESDSDAPEGKENELDPSEIDTCPIDKNRIGFSDRKSDGINSPEIDTSKWDDEISLSSFK
jgi:hypothetical protein